MATIPPPISDEEVQCPYVRAHRPLRKHFETHLVKCRQTQKNIELVTCPFNQSHKIREPEMNWHVSVCPNRASFERYKHVVDPGVVRSNEDVPPVHHQEIESSEDWTDCNEPTYNPDAYASTAPVIRLKVGAPPSERRAFREAERRRLNAQRK